MDGTAYTCTVHSHQCTVLSNFIVGAGHSHGYLLLTCGIETDLGCTGCLAHNLTVLTLPGTDVAVRQRGESYSKTIIKINLVLADCNIDRYGRVFCYSLIAPSRTAMLGIDCLYRHIYLTRQIAAQINAVTVKLAHLAVRKVAT